MSQAAYIQDMMAEPAADPATGPGEVASFYVGRNVLITGGSGFLGRLVIEKLLRSCPDLKTVFLLLRAKKGKNPEDRFKELFDDVVFDRLKRERPGFARKVVLIEGDMAQAGLGLSLEHRDLLRETHIVIHCAATVRFDEQLRIAANINVKGTIELLSLAREMPNLKAFVHVSTAYSNCVQEVIEEKFYPPPIKSTELLSLLDILDDASLNRLTPVLLGKWPNTYAFTKAVAEDAIRRSSKTLPLCIVRPSIIIATSKEPVAGWINNVYGPTGIALGVGLGVLHTLHCDPEKVADLIPADYVINNIIVTAWDIAKAQSINPNSADILMVPESGEHPIYNVVSSCQRPITWGQFTAYNIKYGKDVPTVHAIWAVHFRCNKYQFLHQAAVIFLHLVPAIIIDSLAFLVGRKPMLWQAYKKIHKFSSVIEYFSTQQWRFSNNNVLQLWSRMSPTDRSEFDLNIENLNWEDYYYRHVRGLRVYIAKDPLTTVVQGRTRQTRLKVAHYTLVTVLCGILLWLLWMCLRLISLC